MPKSEEAGSRLSQVANLHILKKLTEDLAKLDLEPPRDDELLGIVQHDSEVVVRGSIGAPPLTVD